MIAIIEKSSVPALSRGLMIIDLLSQNAEMGFNELMKRVDINAPSLNRLLKVLLEEGYITKSKTLKYSLGIKTMLLSRDDILNKTLLLHSSSILENIRRDFGVSALTIAYCNFGMVCVSKTAHPNNVVMQKIGNCSKDYRSTPWGHLYLNQITPAEKNFLLKNEVCEYPQEIHVPTDDELDQYLLFLSQNGYADDFGGCFPHVRRIAAPIYSPGNRLVAALAIGSISSILHEKSQLVAKRITKKAKELSDLLKEG